MEPAARSVFLKKISINGFSIEEGDSHLILRPRGAEATAGVTIEEKEPNIWRVAKAAGAYAKFAVRPKRGYFETYLNQWAAESRLQAPG